MGYGWTHSFNAWVSASPEGNLTVYYPDGHIVEFLADSEGGFVTPPDTYDSLTKNPDTSFSLKTHDQLNYLFSRYFW